MIFFCLTSVLILVGAIILVVGIRLLTDLAIPGWASYLVGIFTVILINVLGFGVSSILIILGNRSNFEVVPARDFEWFVEQCRKVYDGEPS
jgi:hypothetical protein